MLGHGPTEINGVIVRIPLGSRGSGQRSDALQDGPGHAIQGMFDDQVLGAESQEGLDGLIRVPNPKLVQLIGLVKSIVDRSREPGADPHVACSRAVEITRHAGPIDRILSHGSAW